MDHITPERLWSREFRVDEDSMTRGKPGYGIPSLADPGVLVFTDGSQTQDYTGAGIVLTRNNAFMRDQDGETLAFSFRLRNNNSVYQSETWAIKRAAQMIADRVDDGNPNSEASCWISRGEPLTIYSDCQAALKALNSVHIKSRLVMETIDALNNLANKLGTLITLKWVRGHAGFTGNVAADGVAALAGGLEAVDPESPEPPKAILHTEVDVATTQMWRNLWEDNTLGHRQTRYWFPEGPDPQFAFDIIRLPKLICSQVVAFVTGHCHLNRHQSLIDNAETEQIRKHIGNTDSRGEEIIPPSDPTCTMCKFDPSQRNKEETPLHLMTECVGLWKTRLDIFGRHDPRPPFKYSVFQIVAFLKAANIPSFPMQPYLEELSPTTPTGEPDPTPDPDLPRNPTNADQNHPPINQQADRATQNRRNEQQLYPPKPSVHPEGDKWYHTYLYQSNPMPKPHEERERLKEPQSRPLRY